MEIVFDLYKKKTGNSFDQIVHVSYRADTPVEAKNIEATATNGVTAKQADLLINKVHPAVKAVEDAADLPPDEIAKKKAKIKKEMSKVANAVSLDL